MSLFHLLNPTARTLGGVFCPQTGAEAVVGRSDSTRHPSPRYQCCNAIISQSPKGKNMVPRLAKAESLLEMLAQHY